MDLIVTPLVAIIIGIVLCFFGYKVQKALIVLGWFLIGYQIAKGVCVNFIDAEQVLVIVSAIIGLLFSLLGLRLEKLAIFIAIAYFAYGAVIPYITYFEPIVNILIAVLVGIVVGLIALKLIKPIIILVTAAYGATLIKTYLPKLVTLPAIVLTIGFFVLLVAGIVTQAKTN